MGKSKYCLVLALLFTISLLQAQLDDHINWSSIKIQKKIDTKTSFAVAPIIRFNNDLSSYQNFSIDISAKRALGKGFSVQLLSRTWFLPENVQRQFIWFDLGYSKTIEKIKLNSSLRMHYALDIDNVKDGDFIRWKSGITLLNLGKIKPFFAIEPWYRFNGFGNIWRMRYETGFTYQVMKPFDIFLGYRRESSANLDPKTKVNMYLLTLIYKLD